MKIELKHIVGYLPYKIKVIDVSMHENGFRLKHSVKELVITPSNLEIGLKDVDGIKQKPILKPLSKITKYELNHLKNLYFDKEIVTNNISDLCFWWGNTTNLEEIKNVFEYLYKEHFDIHGLIEKGLAIDINTLK